MSTKLSAGRVRSTYAFIKAGRGRMVTARPGCPGVLPEAYSLLCSYSSTNTATWNSSRPARTVRAGTSLVVTVPSVPDHEVVAMDLATNGH